MKKFKPILFGLFVFSASMLSAQSVGISDVIITPNPTSIMELRSTNKGLLIPRVALTQTTSNAPVGAGIPNSLLVYNTATVNDVTPGFYYWENGLWVRMGAGAASASGWELIGNAGTNPATDFLGTTDNQPLVFKANNIEHMRLRPTGNLGIGTTNATARLHVSGTVRFENLAVSTTQTTVLVTDAAGNIEKRTLDPSVFDTECGCLFTDPRDGRQYPTVRINNKCWFADNLKYLPQVWSPADRSSTEPRYHVYNYNSNVVSQAKVTPEFFYYGVLYNHQAVLASGVDAICPPGWKVPTQDDWEDMKTWIMANTHHQNIIGSATLGSSMKSCRQVNSQLQFGGCNTSEWPRFDSDATHFGTNDFGMSLIPGGFMDNNGIFTGIHQSARYWTDYNQFSAMRHYYVNYNMGHIVQVQSPSSNANSYCVRCIRID